MESSRSISLSVVVPIHESATTLRQCLHALMSSRSADTEVIVVDDRSTDGGPSLAASLGATVIRNEGRGPASARNTGARHAPGQILLFVDSDVVVRTETLGQVRAGFAAEPSLAAIFGSYDDDPPAPGFFSQYKNLLHHFIHQSSRAEANTFWAGCGAVRRDVFEQTGGFDAARYLESSIEDIELGLRLRESGHAIRLEKSLRVQHLKRWTCQSLLSTDLLRRALPWSKLILERSGFPNDLNVKTSHRFNALFVWLALASAAFPFPGHLAATVMLLAGVVLLDRRLLAFFAGRRGGPFAAMAFGWHCFYYLYSSAVFAFCWFRHRLISRPSPRGAMEPIPLPAAAE